MEDKNNPPVGFSLSLFPNREPDQAEVVESEPEARMESKLEIEFGPTSQLELEIPPSEEIARRRDKTIRTVGRLVGDPILRKNVEQFVVPVVAMGAAVTADALKKSTPKPSASKRGTGEVLYAGAVKMFAIWRKKRTARLKKQGYNEKTGLIHLQPCEKLPKLPKLPKASGLSEAPKASKIKAYKTKGGR